jgi:hypothetical protein
MRNLISGTFLRVGSDETVAYPGFKSGAVGPEMRETMRKSALILAVLLIAVSE